MCSGITLWSIFCYIPLIILVDSQNKIIIFSAVLKNYAKDISYIIKNFWGTKN